MSIGGSRTMYPSVDFMAEELFSYAFTNRRGTNRLFGHESIHVFSISLPNTIAIRERGHETQHGIVGSCRPWPALPLGRRAVGKIQPWA